MQCNNPISIKHLDTKKGKKINKILYFIDFLRIHYPNSLAKYGIDLKEKENNIEVLDIIGINNNMYYNNHVDYDRVYELLINDFRNLKLGLITLEFPEDKNKNEN